MFHINDVSEDERQCALFQARKTKKINQMENNKTQQTNDDLALFDAIVRQMRDTYAAKNSDYGSSFDKGIKRYGLVSLATRLFDKLNRLETLASGQTPQVKGEKIEDTLLDIANYAILGIMYMCKAYGAGSDAGQPDLSNLQKKINGIMSAYQEIAASNDADGAASLLPEVREMIQAMNQCGGFVSNAVEIGQTLSSVLLCLKNIADGGDGQSEEPALDSRMLYDYQVLCEFLQNPTGAGLPAAYETAQKIMNTNVEDWGANRDFVNQVVSVAEQVIGMHDGSIGKVVPFNK